MNFQGAASLASKVKRTDAMVTVGFEGDEESFQTILRSKMTTHAMNTLFNTSVEYLRDLDDNIHWPWQWTETCRGPPQKYFVVETMPNHSFPDAAVDEDHIGGTAIFLLNVPGNVTEKHLRVWIRKGCALSDFRINKLEEAKRLLTNRLRSIEVMKAEFVAAERRREEQRLKELEEMEKEAVVDPYRHDKLQKEVDEEKERRASMAMEEDRRVHKDFETEVALMPEMIQLDNAKKDIIDFRLPRIDEKLETLLSMYRTLAVRISWVCIQGQGILGDHHDRFPVAEARGKALEASWWEQEQVLAGKGSKIERLHTWKVHIVNDPGGYISDRMVMYSGWPRVRLREAADGALYSWFEAPGEHVDLPDKFIDGAEDCNMRGVSVVRLKHGPGASYDADLFTVYSGGWKAGRKHGFGAEISGEGIFEGDFEKGKRRGKGRLRTADGDEYVGEFGDGTDMIGGRRRYKYVTEVGSLRSDLDLEGNPYLRGSANGSGRMVFADGSWYIGQFTQSKPHGIGKYMRSDGVVMEGQFKDGVLHGPGTTTFADGSMEAGLYRHGQLVRRGERYSAEGHRYAGDFMRGLRHGVGEYNGSTGDSNYTGSWSFDSRSGMGTQLWQDPNVQHRLASFWRGDVARLSRGSLLYMPRYFNKNGDSSLPLPEVKDGDDGDHGGSERKKNQPKSPVIRKAQFQHGKIAGQLGGVRGLGMVNSYRRSLQHALFHGVAADAARVLERNERKGKAAEEKGEKRHSTVLREEVKRAHEEQEEIARRNALLWRLGVDMEEAGDDDESQGPKLSAEEAKTLVRTRQRKRTFQPLPFELQELQGSQDVTALSDFNAEDIAAAVEEAGSSAGAGAGTEHDPRNEFLKEIIAKRKEVADAMAKEVEEEGAKQERRMNLKAKDGDVPEYLTITSTNTRSQLGTGVIRNLAYPSLYYSGPNNHVSVRASRHDLATVIDHESEQLSIHRRHYYDHENKHRANAEDLAIARSLDHRRKWIRAKKSWNVLRKGGSGSLEKIGLYE